MHGFLSPEFPISGAEGGSPPPGVGRPQGRLVPPFTRRKEAPNVLLALAVSLVTLIKIINMPKWHILGVAVLLPYTNKFY